MAVDDAELTSTYDLAVDNVLDSEVVKLEQARHAQRTKAEKRWGLGDEILLNSYVLNYSVFS